MKITASDQRLLSLLREDARASTAQIARRLGLSRTTVQSRIERLEREGVICGYTVRTRDDSGDGKAAITGDFVLTGKEVNPVIKALRQNGIEVTALHSHMLDEQPRLFFMHFWANDDAIKLAKGLRAALDKTASAKS